MHPERKEGWCFVTGMPRSGTTFVASVLSAGPRVAYVHEPFNARCGIAGVDWAAARRVDDQLHPGTPDAANAARHVTSMQYRLTTLVPDTDRPMRRIGKQLLGSRGPWHLRLSKLAKALGVAKYGVVKDPTAWYYAPFMRRDVGLPAVYTIKHPIAQVSSYRRAGWRPDLTRIKSQPHLLDRLTLDDRRLLDGLDPDAGDVDAEVAIEWRLITRLLDGFATEDSGEAWHRVVIEHLSERPDAAFFELATAVGLPFDRFARRRVAKLTGGSSGEARNGRFQDLRRDSSQVLEAHRRHFTPDELQKIFDITADVAEHIYGTESF